MPRELTRSGKTFDGEPKVACQSNRAPLQRSPAVSLVWKEVERMLVKIQFNLAIYVPVRAWVATLIAFYQR